MKQHIKIEQLGELKSKELKKFYTWMVDQFFWTKDMDMSYFKMALGREQDSPSIGQMIEFIQDNDYGFSIDFGGTLEISKLGVWGDASRSELCDKLWEAVKYILNNTI